MEKARLNSTASTISYPSDDLAGMRLTGSVEGIDVPRNAPNRQQRRAAVSMRTIGMLGEMKPWTPYERAKKRLKTALGRAMNVTRLRLAKSNNR
jgi:hypothetical protein